MTAEFAPTHQPGVVTAIALNSPAHPAAGGIPPMTVDEAKRYLGQTSGWQLDSAATRIERTFKFANFKESIEFVHQIGALAEAEAHHPDIRELARTTGAPA